MKGYKWITSNMKSAHGDVTWKLNEQQVHGKNLKLCKSGFHACKTPFESLQYINGDRLFEVEAENIIEGKDKFVASKMTLVKELPVKEIMVRFAIACAKRSLHYFEDKYPDDDRPRKAIEAAEMGNTAAAGYAAARAARVAAYAASDASDASYAASDASYAADAAADAAAAAADAAAEAAARAAADAARAAAEAAAYAARAAARAAEKKWQSEKLEEIIQEIKL